MPPDYYVAQVAKCPKTPNLYNSDAKRYGNIRTIRE